jgi:hypothetical protein
MIWLTWRQHRQQAVVAVLLLAALAALLVPSGRQMHREFVDSGLAQCLETMSRAEFIPDQGSGCDGPAALFSDRYRTFTILAIIFAVLPLLVGLFFGAPLVARELEHGTHRLVWTQGATRRRWALVTFGLVGVGTTALAVGYALLVSWWLDPLAQASAARFGYRLFDVVGVVPIAYTVFAVAAGVLAGTIWRAVPAAMAATLVAFIAARVVVWLARPHFMPARQRRFSITAEARPNRLLGDWLLDFGLYDVDGHKLQRVGRVSCLPGSPACAQYPVGSYNLHTYQPAARFWPFQLIETGLFVAVAAVLLVVAIHRVRRRLS